MEYSDALMLWWSMCESVMTKTYYPTGVYASHTVMLTPVSSINVLLQIISEPNIKSGYKPIIKLMVCRWSWHNMQRLCAASLTDDAKSSKNVITSVII